MASLLFFVTGSRRTALYLLNICHLIEWVNLAWNVNIDHASVKSPVISITPVPSSHSTTSATSRPDSSAIAVQVSPFASIILIPTST